MVQWFRNLSDANKIAIVVPVGLALLGGLLAFLKWLFKKKKDPDLALSIIDTTLKENRQLRHTVKQLEEKLAKPALQTGIASEQSTPVPSAEARELATLITEDDGLYAQALKAIAEGDNAKADRLLDQTQQYLDTVQRRKDQAQARIYLARMRNASYAGGPQEALQYCDELKILGGNDSLILNEIAMVYYENAKYEDAEPLMQRALQIDEAALRQDHPTVARDLNNLAVLYQATNRLADAEPLMQRALKIDEAALGQDHPKVAIRLNNLAQLYRATNRLAEAEPLMERVLVILLQFTGRTGHPHPHLEGTIKNYTNLLMQMGHSPNEVNDRLKRLAPERFDAKEKPGKEE